MNNILKHSGATEVEIVLRKVKAGLNLVIQDNGNGFDAGIHGDGIGLMNINNRASLYNGVVNINSSPGSGCKMEIAFG